MAKTHSKRATAASVSLIALAGAALGAAVMATAEAQDNLTPSLTAGIAPGSAPSFADLIEHVGPAVVSVEVVTSVPSDGLAGLNTDDLPPALQEFFDFYRQNQGQDAAPREARGAGSGFFISPDGLVVTNNHVVADATKITVTLTDGRELDAEVVGTDEPTDLALLRVEGANFPFVQFDTNPHYRVGDWVVAVGNPFGLGGTATAGIISALGREEPNARYNGFIQIDAPINRGNSGGPTFDLNGNVIGVNSQIFSPTGGNVGIGFAIPSDVASNIVTQLAEKGSVTRGWLGVQIQDLDERLANAIAGAKAGDGALVAAVTAGSPAEAAGLQIGDIIVQMDGDEVDGGTDLTRQVGSLQVGQTYAVDIVRNGQQRRLNVTLQARPSDDVLFAEATPSAGKTPQPAASVESSMGLSLAPLTSSTRTELGLDDDVQGVAVTNVARGSKAAEYGFRPGIVIRQVDGQAITTPAEFDAAIAAARSEGKTAAALLVRVGQNSQFIALPLDETDAG